MSSHKNDWGILWKMFTHFWEEHIHRSAWHVTIWVDSGHSATSIPVQATTLMTGIPQRCPCRRGPSQALTPTRSSRAPPSSVNHQHEGLIMITLPTARPPTDHRSACMSRAPHLSDDHPARPLHVPRPFEVKWPLVDTVHYALLAPWSSG